MHATFQDQSTEFTAEGELTGSGQDFLQSLGALGRALLRLRPEFASFCPNLVAEADWVSMRHS